MSDKWTMKIGGRLRRQQCIGALTEKKSVTVEIKLGKGIPMVPKEKFLLKTDLFELVYTKL